ncbi:MAG TPA: ROK family protein [Candidatus Acidoferrales bacterium]|nr:ROK family protein [Candidatus Acidoferrales bacterium]
MDETVQSGAGAFDAARPGEGQPAGAGGPAHDGPLGVGVDVGGTGIKAAVVDLATGSLVSARIREKTPSPSTPVAVAEVIGRIIGKIEAAGQDTSGLRAGAGLPGVVKDGWLKTAANIDHAWLDTRAEDVLERELSRPVLIINDADAAGLAEMRYGAGVGYHGVVLMLTIGTGIGSALFVDGCLVPNTELGHLEFHRHDAETLVSGAARERRKLGWKAWAKEFDAYLDGVYRYFSPDLMILGGGVSKETARYLSYLTPRGPLEIARLLNSAGIVGAALAAAEAHGYRPPESAGAREAAGG